MSDETPEAPQAAPRAKKLPRFADFHRYEGRVTKRQWRRLDATREKLTEANRKGRIRDKTLKTERLTENSIIRIAVDVLLDNFAEGIHGHTEKDVAENVRRFVAERMVSDENQGREESDQS